MTDIDQLYYDKNYDTIHYAQKKIREKLINDAGWICDSTYVRNNTLVNDGYDTTVKQFELDKYLNILSYLENSVEKLPVLYNHYLISLLEY